MKTNFIAIALGVFLFAIPFAAHAQSLGIQFGKMPVGTKAYYQQSNGEKWVDIYRGVKLGQYYVERYAGHSKTSGRPIKKLYFDNQGREVAYQAYNDSGNQYRIANKPYSCYRVLGKCSFSRRFTTLGLVGSGTSTKTNVMIEKAKGGYVVNWHRKKEPNKGGRYFFALGEYNLAKVERWGASNQHFIKLVKVQSP